MAGDEKVWVEAEQHGAGAVVLTLVDVAKRRRIYQKYGNHNVNTVIEQLQHFPMQFLERLRQGYPVRFKMYESAFEKMVTGKLSAPSRGEADFEGAGDDTDTSHRYEVVVGNIGTVIRTNDAAKAHRAFIEYRRQSVEGEGRAAGESVVWMRDDEVYKEHAGEQSEAGFRGHEDESDEEPPTQDDLNNNAVIYEVRRGYALVIDGKTIEEFTTRQHEVPQDAAFQYARAWMDKNKYWPNLYFVNERGNIELMDHQTGAFIRGWA